MWSADSSISEMNTLGDVHLKCTTYVCSGVCAHILFCKTLCVQPFEAPTRQINGNLTIYLSIISFDFRVCALMIPVDFLCCGIHQM